MQNQFELFVAELNQLFTTNIFDFMKLHYLAFKTKCINSIFIQHPLSQNSYQVDKQEDPHLSMKRNNHTVLNNSMYLLNKTLKSNFLYKKM